MTLRLKLMGELIPAMAAMIGSGLYHGVIGSRILQSEFAETKGQRGSQASVQGKGLLQNRGAKELQLLSEVCDLITLPDIRPE